VAISPPKVCIIYTGGTIGMIRDADGVLHPPDDPSNFLRIAPELLEIAEVDLAVVSNKDSTNINPADWAAMATEVYERIIAGPTYSGFVIVHGTDTMHFSASALAFAFGPNLNVPVVFTGAQTDASVIHGDARINLVRAVRVALESIAEVVICFGDHVFRGCRTQKRDERRFAAFDSPALYPLADITERIMVHPSARRVRSHVAPIDFRPNFDCDIIQISLIPGLRPKSLVPLLDPVSCDGVVLQSFGAGNLPDSGEYSFESFIREGVARAIPIIITSQFPANSTMRTAYEPGVRAVAAGAIPTGNMTNACATVKFRWVLRIVHAEIDDGRIPKKWLITRVAELMSRPYVGEMDVS
jgi:L-asparaginase type I